ncbi:MAG: 2-C-methyl-D-erythritol 4-phosphate cytidylyltransferase [Mangrovibacterium sp.]
MEKIALIIAGGKGLRMQTSVPKQFLKLGGKPVLMRTMERFLTYDPQIRLVVVLPAGTKNFWEALKRRHNFTAVHRVVEGGASRFQSVRNGLAGLPGDSLVFIHDGVRPLVSLQTLARCEQKAMEKGNALPVLPETESLRKLTATGSVSADRSCFFRVQTPQTFHTEDIRKAYDQPEQSSFTDDASVYEARGGQIHLVEGNPENIKLTGLFDLQLAEYFFRAGTGSIPR